MASTDKSVEQLFTQIKKFGQDGSYNKSLPLVVEVLRRNPKDIDALQCKVVCLLKLDKCREAYHVMTTDKELCKHSMWYERAYALYRQNKLEDAIAELDKAENSPKKQELLAQIYYKLDNYEDAAEVYKALVKNTVDSNTNERETNLAATLASSAMFTNKPLKWVGLRESTYELCYNSACYSLAATDDIAATEAKLAKARDLCVREFEDDEVECKAELAPIQVMTGLCHQRSGNIKEAMNLYSTVIKEKCGDTQTMAVAANNIICINKDQNMFDSKKKIKIASGEAVNKKLTPSQKNNILFNSCLLNFYTNQLEQFKKKSTVLSESGSPLAPLLLATAYIRDKKPDIALDLLEKSGSKEDLVLLALAELQKKAGNYTDAANTLKRIETWTNTPGMISTITSLLFAGSGPAAAADHLDSSLQNLRNSGEYPADKIAEWRIQSAKFRLSHNMPEKAAEILENMLESDPHNIKALALLIRSVSLYDAPRAHEVAQRLPEIEIPSDINVQELEIGLGVTSGRGLRKVIKPEQEKINEANRRFETKEKKRKKKKGKLPKVLIDGGADPERWIPRQERSYYRRKKRNRNEAIGKGSQGLSAMNRAAEQALDMSDKPPTHQDSEPAPQQPPPPTKPTPAKSNKPKSKGKKKGKGKW